MKLPQHCQKNLLKQQMWRVILFPFLFPCLKYEFFVGKIFSLFVLFPFLLIWHDDIRGSWNDHGWAFIGLVTEQMLVDNHCYYSYYLYSSRTTHWWLSGSNIRFVNSTSIIFSDCWEEISCLQSLCFIHRKLCRHQQHYLWHSKFFFEKYVFCSINNILDMTPCHLLKILCIWREIKMKTIQDKCSVIMPPEPDYSSFK